MPVRKSFLVLVACAALLQGGVQDIPVDEKPLAAAPPPPTTHARGCSEELVFDLGADSGSPSRLSVFLRTEGFGSIQKKRLYVATRHRDGTLREDLVIDPMEQAAWLPISERSFAAADLISFDAVKESDQSILIAASYGGGSGDLNWNDQPCGRNVLTGEQENGFRILMAGEYRLAPDGTGAFKELLTVTDLDESIYSACPCYGEWLPSGHIRLEINTGAPGRFILIEPAALHFDLAGEDCEQPPITRELRFTHSGTQRTILSLEQGEVRRRKARTVAGSNPL